MKSILAKDYQIHFSDYAYAELNKMIENTAISKLFIIADKNTLAFCYPRLKEKLSINKTVEILEIGIGENQKTIETCEQLWIKLCDLQADRSALILNLGGGIVSDLGGFVAATLKRGIRFINIPTTLLGMVDAAIGGKTGINLGALKNQVGAFSNPSMIVIDTAYLNSLPAREFRSGMSEILKYGLSYDENLYQLIKAYEETDFETLEKLIYRSIEIKNEVVLKDPQEQNLRKVLNFGHSLGHAIESLFLSKLEENHITHGEAVAAGMVLAAHLSSQYLGFSLEKTAEIKCHIQKYFGQIELLKPDYHLILNLLKHDKKAESGCVKFVLITQIGRFKLNCEVGETAIIKALDYYNT